MARGLIGVAAILWLAACLPAAAQAPSVCPDDFTAFADTTDPLTCTCDAAATERGSVWGMDVYTGDSAICRAARHAGIGARGVGTVTVFPEPGRAAYAGVTRNGVQSINYGRFASSFRFAQAGGQVPAPSQAPAGGQAAAPGLSVCPDDFGAFADGGESLTCTCSAEATGRGSVWGMDVYTTDSGLCRAALHAGAIPRNGGAVTAIPEAGRAAYPGVTRNGVASNNYGAYASSVRFAQAGGNAPAAPPPPAAAPPAASASVSVCPDNFSAFAGTTDPLTCTCAGEALGRGSVWGMDVYTGDSGLCRAALHAGIVGRAGGTVTVIPEAGRGAYPGVTRNGVSSSNYGAYRSSFRFAQGGGSAQGGGTAPAGGAQAAAVVSVCPDNFSAFADATDPLTCACAGEALARGSVWGMDTYTGDSSVCRAAVHAGAVGRGGGTVTVVPEAGRQAYPGVTRNGVSSSNYGAYRSSFRFAQAGGAAAPVAGSVGPGAAASVCPDNFVAYADTADAVACTCPAEATGRGSVWGMDVYTGDSSVCRAALHAGFVGRAGGPVTVRPEPGRNAYPGVTRNGVSSSNYGRYASSFRFEGTPQQAAVAPPPPPAPPPVAPVAAPVQQPIAETIRQRGEVALYITFKFNSADLDMSSAETLLELRNVLRGDPALRLLLVGHTDSVGGADYNLRLSQRRAQSTKAWLTSQGIAGSRLTTGGQGAEQPLADNATEAGRAANRRVQAVRMP